MHQMPVKKIIVCLLLALTHNVVAGCEKSESNPGKTSPSAVSDPNGGSEAGGGTETGDGGGIGEDTGIATDGMDSSAGADAGMEGGKAPIEDGDPPPVTTVGTVNVDTAGVSAATATLAINNDASLVPPHTNAEVLPVGTVGLATALRSIRAPTRAFTDTGTAYSKTTRRVYVNDESMQALNRVNQLLRDIELSGYLEMVNQGPYIAKIASEGSYKTLLVDATRTSEGTPLDVKIWIDDLNPIPDRIQIDEDGLSTELHLKIARGASQANRFGLIRLSWISRPANYRTYPPAIDDMVPPQSQGTLETSEKADGSAIYVTLHETKNGFSQMKLKAVYDLDTKDFTFIGGKAKTEISTPSFATYDLAFGERYYRSKKNDGSNITETCLDRQTSGFAVNEYMLFDQATGSVADFSPYRKNVFYEEDVNGTVYRRKGFIVSNFSGPASLSLPDYGLALPPDGYQLYEEDPMKPDHKGKVWTVRVRKGDLRRHARTALTSAQLADRALYVSNSGTFYVLRWDDANNQFLRIAMKNGDDKWQAITPPVADVDTFTDDAAAHASEISLSSYIVSTTKINFFYDKDASPKVRNIYTRSDEYVTFSQQSDLTLKCWHECPYHDQTLARHTGGTEYKPTVDIVYNTDTPYTYIFDGSTKLLKDGINPVELQFNRAQAEAASQVGVVRGSYLIENTYYNTITNNGAASANSHLGITSVEDLDVYYMWKTSVYDTQWLVYLEDQSNNTYFPQPRPEALYTHLKSNDFTDAATSPYYNKTFRYAPELFATRYLPWVRGDFAFGTYDPEPDFILKDGIVIGPWAHKVTDLTEKMQPAGSNQCAPLVLDDQLTLPDAGFYVAPAMGPKPALPAAVTFIDGVKQ